MSHCGDYEKLLRRGERFSTIYSLLTLLKCTPIELHLWVRTSVSPKCKTYLLKVGECRSKYFSHKRRKRESCFVSAKCAASCFPPGRAGWKWHNVLFVFVCWNSQHARLSVYVHLLVIGSECDPQHLRNRWSVAVRECFRGNHISVRDHYHNIDI